MLRMTRQADYAIVLLTYFAHHPTVAVYNARDLAGHVHLPEPMVGKILKLLAKSGLLSSLRGVKGGYRLTRAPEGISVAEIVARHFTQSCGTPDRVRRVAALHGWAGERQIGPG